MKCPDCDRYLARRVTHSIEYHHCSLCHGLWFQKNDIKKIAVSIKKKPFSVPPKNFKSKLVPKTETARSCPSCKGKTMDIKFYKEIAIDCCPQCKGLWLDGGEVLLLIKCIQKDQQYAAKNSTLSPETTVELSFYSLDLIIQILISL